MALINDNVDSVLAYLWSWFMLGLRSLWSLILTYPDEASIVITMVLAISVFYLIRNLFRILWKTFKFMVQFCLILTVVVVGLRCYSRGPDALLKDLPSFAMNVYALTTSYFYRLLYIWGALSANEAQGFRFAYSQVDKILQRY
ncbi:unnamed protein product [Kuraishia capsulata CBS 1993]|uniref:Uncharacterized protein n=1 Tax=Kuraishia capsulata CBS 1993 TaxID=1382522 RepID=W6MPN1_9ASCO|nr:uncharacterized protein KUCA_T00004658001 [Kuraishia capsulata CBS 1993]CDK28674.1 unnamed protein product [Kuraishia capsulata CBS 1993]